MDAKEKLIEMIQSATNGCARYWASLIADKLLAEGVIVPPCKVGQKVYKVYDIESVHRRALELEVLLIEIGNITRICLKTTKNYLYNFDKASFEDFGKTVFLTREEAEKALAERSNPNA